MELIEEAAPYLPRLLTGTGARVKVAFTDRDGGVSDPPYHSLNLGLLVGDEEGCVWENRIRVAKAAGFDADDLALARQVHGADVVRVEGPGMVGEADVLITDQPNRPIGILTADCSPVILEGTSSVAVVHAGWRGVVAGAVEAGLEAVGDVQRAWIGPSIHACCYEVGPEVIAAFEKKNLPIADGSHVDPARGAEAILTRAGVTEVVVSDVCTHHDERYFSFRRDGTTGRQGAFAWIQG
jgi:YfiH family protein